MLFTKNRSSSGRQKIIRILYWALRYASRISSGCQPEFPVLRWLVHLPDCVQLFIKAHLDRELHLPSRRRRPFIHRQADTRAAWISRRRCPLDDCVPRTRKFYNAVLRLMDGRVFRDLSCGNCFLWWCCLLMVSASLWTTIFRCVRWIFEGLYVIEVLFLVGEVGAGKFGLGVMRIRVMCIDSLVLLNSAEILRGEINASPHVVQLTFIASLFNSARCFQ